MIICWPNRGSRWWKGGKNGVGGRYGGLLGYHLKHSGVTITDASGGRDAGVGIWKPAMTSALKGLPKTELEPYKGDQKLARDDVPVPNVAGKSVGDAEEELESAGFSVVHARQDSSRRRGAFLGFSPSGGTAPKYSNIYAYYSSGPRQSARTLTKHVNRSRSDKHDHLKHRGHKHQRGKDDHGGKRAHQGNQDAHRSKRNDR